MQKVAAGKPDAVIGGTQNVDAYAQIKAMVQLKFNPKFVFLSNGPNDPAEFPSKVGAKNVNGVFAAGDWFPEEHSFGNAAFVAAYHKAYGAGAHRSDVGRSLRRGSARRGCREQDALDLERERSSPHSTRANGRPWRAT